MQQIVKETKIKYIYYTDNLPFPTYERTNSKQLLIANNLIITNPQQYHNSVMILNKNDDQFRELVENANYIEILSDQLLLIKINNTIILKTKTFNYFNADDSISVDIANGGYSINLDGELVPGPDIEDIKVEYIIASGI